MFLFLVPLKRLFFLSNLKSARYLTTSEVNHPLITKTVAGKFLTSVFSRMVWSNEKTAAIITVDIIPFFLPYFLAVWMLSSPKIKTSPNPRKLHPVDGKAGTTMPIGNPNSSAFCADITITLVIKT